MTDDPKAHGFEKLRQVRIEKMERLREGGVNRGTFLRFHFRPLCESECPKRAIFLVRSLDATAVRL